LVADWTRHLRAENKAGKTIKSYLEALRLLAGFEAGVDPVKADRRTVEAFIADQLQRWQPATAANRYRALQQFYRWAYDEGICDTNRMAGMKPPRVPEQPVPVVSLDDLRALLGACSVKGRQRRGPSTGTGTSLAAGTRRSQVSPF